MEFHLRFLLSPVTPRYIFFSAFFVTGLALNQHLLLPQKSPSDPLPPLTCGPLPENDLMKSPPPLSMGAANLRSPGEIKGTEYSWSSLIMGGLNDLSGTRGAMNRSPPSLAGPL